MMQERTHPPGSGDRGHRSVNQRIAQRVDSYGDTIHVLHDRLEDRGSNFAAGYLEDLALRVDRMSDRLKRGDYRGTAREVRGFAADHPELFLGFVFAGGAIAGRFIGEKIVQQKDRTQAVIIHEPVRPVASTEPTAHILHGGG